MGERIGEEDGGIVSYAYCPIVTVQAHIVDTQ